MDRREHLATLRAKLASFVGSPLHSIRIGHGSARELIRSLDLARAYRDLRYMVRGDFEKPSEIEEVEVLSRVVGLVTIHEWLCEGGHELDELRDYATQLYRPIEVEGDDAEEEERKILTLLELREHSCALHQVLRELEGRDDGSAPAPYPDELPVSRVVDLARELAARARVFEDSLDTGLRDSCECCRRCSRRPCDLMIKTCGESCEGRCLCASEEPSS